MSKIKGKETEKVFRVVRNFIASLHFVFLGRSHLEKGSFMRPLTSERWGSQVPNCPRLPGKIPLLKYTRPHFLHHKAQASFLPLLGFSAPSTAPFEAEKDLLGLRRTLPSLHLPNLDSTRLPAAFHPPTLTPSPRGLPKHLPPSPTFSPSPPRAQQGSDRRPLAPRGPCPAASRGLPGPAPRSPGAPRQGSALPAPRYLLRGFRHGAAGGRHVRGRKAAGRRHPGKCSLGRFLSASVRLS